VLDDRLLVFLRVVMRIAPLDVRLDLLLNEAQGILGPARRRERHVRNQEDQRVTHPNGPTPSSKTEVTPAVLISLRGRGRRTSRLLGSNRRRFGCRDGWFFHGRRRLVRGARLGRRSRRRSRLVGLSLHRVRLRMAAVAGRGFVLATGGRRRRSGR